MNTARGQNPISIAYPISISNYKWVVVVRIRVGVRFRVGIGWILEFKKIIIYL